MCSRCGLQWDDGEKPPACKTAKEIGNEALVRIKEGLARESARPL